MKHILAREEIARILRAKYDRLDIKDTARVRQLSLMSDWLRAHSDEQLIDLAIDYDLTDVLVYEHEVMCAEPLQ